MKRLSIRRPQRSDHPSVTTSHPRPSASDVEAPPQLVHSLDTIPVLPPRGNVADGNVFGDNVTDDTHDSGASTPAEGGVIQRAILTAKGEPYKSLRSVQSANWYRKLGTEEKKLATQIHLDTKKYAGKENVTANEALALIRRPPKPNNNPIVLDTSEDEEEDSDGNDFDFDKAIVLESEDDEREEKEEKKEKKNKKSQPLEDDEEDPFLDSGYTSNEDEDDGEDAASYDEEDPLLDNDSVSEKSDNGESSEEEPPKKKRKVGSETVTKAKGKKITKRKHDKSRARLGRKRSESNLRIGRFARKTLARGVGGQKIKKRTRTYSVAFVTFNITTSGGNQVELPLEEQGKPLSFINLKTVGNIPKTKLDKINRRTSLRGVTDTGSGKKRWTSHLGLQGAIANTNAHAEVAIAEYLLEHQGSIIEEISGKLDEGETLQSVTLIVDIDKPPCSGCTNKLSIAHDGLSKALGAPVYFSVVYPEKKSNEGIREKYSRVRNEGDTDEESASDSDIKEESAIPVRYGRDEEVSDDSSDESSSDENSSDDEAKPLIRRAPARKTPARKEPAKRTFGAKAPEKKIAKKPVKRIARNAPVKKKQVKKQPKETKPLLSNTTTTTTNTKKRKRTTRLDER